jgi:hypothetical protein
MFRFSLLSILSLFTLISCSKEAGEGGSASISGKVFGYDVNTSGVITDSAYAGDYRVYISYGDNSAADNDVRTSYSGDYTFKGLRKGNYKVYVFSQCDTCVFNQNYLVQDVEITSNKQDLILPDFVIYD